MGSYFFNKFSGVQLMTAAIISLSVQSLLANVTVSTPLHITRAIIILSNIYIIVLWTVILIGRNTENVYTLKLGLLLWSIFICLWIGVTLFSNISAVGEKYLCGHMRCPESLWLFNSTWHCDWSLLIKYDYDLDSNYLVKPVRRHTTEFDEYNQHHHHKGNLKNSDSSYDNYDNYKDSEEIVNNSMSIKAKQSKKSNKMQILKKLEKQESHTSKMESNNVFSDYEISQPVKLKLGLENISNMNIFYLTIVIGLIFSVFTIGWLVLFNYLIILNRQNESRGCL